MGMWNYGVAGMRHVHIAGLDVLSETPEGTVLLDGILEELLDKR